MPSISSIKRTEGMVAAREGVIKFLLDFQPGPAPKANLLPPLAAWRQVFRQRGLLGQDPQRYAGYGFGNLSRRLPGRSDQGFIITGTQTGALEHLTPQDYAIVLSCDPFNNRLTASGPVKPSSEALSHGILYQSAPAINWVMHLHSPDIFSACRELALPCTDPAVAYGTPEMAREIRRIALRHDSSCPCLLVMAGHQDGILAFGENADATGELVINTLERAIRHA
ncbi:MAG: class II aldolase/adducin family protein [Desulfuromonadales bacterium]